MQLNNETLDFITDSFEQIRVFASEESSHERGVSFVHSRFPRVFKSNSVLKLVVVKNVSIHWNPACLGFLQSVMMTRLMMNGDKVFVRADLFDATSPFWCQL